MTGAMVIAALSINRFAKNGTDREEILEDALQEVADSDDIHAAVALAANTKLVKAYRRGGEIIEITGDGLKFAQKFLSPKAALATQNIRPGSLIRIRKNEKGAWQIVQLPSGRSLAGFNKFA